MRVDKRHQSHKPQSLTRAPQGFATVSGRDAWFTVDDDGDLVQTTYGQEGGEKPEHYDVAIHEKGGIVRYLTWIVIFACAAACVLVYLPKIL